MRHCRLEDGQYLAGVEFTGDLEWAPAKLEGPVYSPSIAPVLVVALFCVAFVVLIVLTTSSA